MHHAIGFIANELNTALKNQFGTPENIVTVGRLKNLDGSISEENAEKLVLSVVNITSETIKNFTQSRRMGFAGSGEMSKTPSLNLNLSVLVAANFSDELKGLKHLNSAIQFFHAYPDFNQTNSPNLPSETLKIILEPYNLSLQDVESVWGSLGCNSLPGILYNVRVMSADEDVIATTVEGVKNPNLPNGPK